MSSFPFFPFTSYPCLSSADPNYHSQTRDCSRYSPTKHTKFTARTKDKDGIIHKINFGRSFKVHQRRGRLSVVIKIYPESDHFSPMHWPRAPVQLQQPPVWPPASALPHSEGRSDFKTAAMWSFQNTVRSPQSSAQTVPWTSQFTQREAQSLTLNKDLTTGPTWTPTPPHSCLHSNSTSQWGLPWLPHRNNFLTPFFIPLSCFIFTFNALINIVCVFKVFLVTFCPLLLKCKLHKSSLFCLDFSRISYP